MIVDSVKSRIAALNDDNFLKMCISYNLSPEKVRKEMMELIEKRNNEKNNDLELDFSKYSKESKAVVLMGAAAKFNEGFLNNYKNEYKGKVLFTSDFVEGFDLENIAKSGTNLVLVVGDMDKYKIVEHSTKLNKLGYEMELSYLETTMESLLDSNLRNFFEGRKDKFVDPKEILNFDTSGYLNYSHIVDSSLNIFSRYRGFIYISGQGQGAMRNSTISEIMKNAKFAENVKKANDELVLPSVKETSLNTFQNNKKTYYKIADFVRIKGKGKTTIR